MIVTLIAFLRLFSGVFPLGVPAKSVSCPYYIGKSLKLLSHDSENRVKNGENLVATAESVQKLPHSPANGGIERESYSNSVGGLQGGSISS
jgi:hypothetical protein